MKRIDYSPGQLVNGLRLIRETNGYRDKHRLYRTGIFECKCGSEFETQITSVVSGNTKSCGCFKLKRTSELFFKHGSNKHPLYSTWKSMKTRCYNSVRVDYKYYGGKGVCVSDEFKHDFIAWFDYVSSLPGYKKRKESNLTIDRIDGSKGYERGNMRWATKLQQVENRSCL